MTRSTRGTSFFIPLSIGSRMCIPESACGRHGGKDYRGFPCPGQAPGEEHGADVVDRRGSPPRLLTSPSRSPSGVLRNRRQKNAAIPVTPNWVPSLHGDSMMPSEARRRKSPCPSWKLHLAEARGFVHPEHQGLHAEMLPQPVAAALPSGRRGRGDARRPRSVPGTVAVS